LRWVSCKWDWATSCCYSINIYTYWLP